MLGSFLSLRRLSILLRKGRVAIMLGFALLVFVLPQSSLLLRSRTLNKFGSILDAFERRSIDYRFQWRGPTPANPQVVIVGIDSTSYDPNSFRPEELEHSEPLRLMVEHPFPWNRKLFARLIDKLADAGVRAIIFDLLFVSANEGDPELRAAMDRHPDLVAVGLATEEKTTGEGQPEVTFLRPNPQLVPELNSAQQGFVVLHPDEDLVVRRFDYFSSELREKGLEDDAVEFLGLGPRAFEKATKRSEPTPFGSIINFQGPGHTYPHCRLEEIFIPKIYENDPRYKGGASLRDKVVFVGPIAELFRDVHQTPFGVMPGVEIHAQIAASLLSGTRLQHSSATFDGWLALSFALLPAAIVLCVRQALIQTGLLLSLVASFLALAQMCFVESHLIIPTIPALFGLIVVGSFGVTFHFAIEQLERTRIRSVLDRYVSKNVAKLVIDQGDSFEENLRGNRKSATVLFSDIRGFTSIFESSDAEQLVAQLNEYFLEMVDVVLRQDGTLQKFIGDAIMAVWGDTHSAGLAADAARSVRSALLMREGLQRLNARWRNLPDRLELEIGVGVNHGEVIVGNVGHPLRMEFTVLGDAINLAARLESATKQFRCDILVGQKAQELTEKEFVYRRVDRLRLKGKTIPVEVFIPLSSASIAPPPWLTPYHQGVDLYRARQFAEAIPFFQSALAQLANHDFLCSMYIQRCSEFILQPPAAEWDGSFTLTEK